LGDARSAVRVLGVVAGAGRAAVLAVPALAVVAPPLVRALVVAPTAIAVAVVAVTGAAGDGSLRAVAAIGGRGGRARRQNREEHGEKAGAPTSAETPEPPARRFHPTGLLRFPGRASTPCRIAAAEAWTR
jgi:hypothetical protein